MSDRWTRSGSWTASAEDRLIVLPEPSKEELLALPLDTEVVGIQVAPFGMAVGAGGFRMTEKVRTEIAEYDGVLGYAYVVCLPPDVVVPDTMPDASNEKGN